MGMRKLDTPTFPTPFPPRPEAHSVLLPRAAGGPRGRCGSAEVELKRCSRDPEGSSTGREQSSLI